MNLSGEIKELCAHCGIERGEPTKEKFRELQLEALRIFETKNADYGDSFKEDGILGVMIRAKDKLNRLIALARKDGERAVKEESVRDTLIDFSNYSLMAIIAHEDGEPWGRPNLTSNLLSEIESNAAGWHPYFCPVRGCTMATKVLPPADCRDEFKKQEVCRSCPNRPGQNPTGGPHADVSGSIA